MLNKVRKEDITFYRMHLGLLGLTYLHRSNPWTAAWWSAALPGFGQLYVGSLVKGIIFMSGEIFINLKSRINLAIFYTFIGEFEKANHVLNQRWALFYMAVWVFAIYDAYRESIQMNRLCELEEMQEVRYFNRFKISETGISSLDQCSPWLAVFFSTFLGGMGQIYTNQFLKGFVLLAWTMVINYYGQTNHLLAKFILDKEVYLQQVSWQWLLFLPSIQGFCIWDAYASAVEINKLVVEEQRYRLGHKRNIHRVNEGRNFPMYVMGICKQSVYLELIINSLKTQGFDKYHIVFFDRFNNKTRETGDSIRKSDGVSNFNGAMCGASVLMLFGTMFGGTFIPGGPIAIGLAGFLTGALIGYLTDRYVVGWVLKKLKKDPIKGSNSVDGEVLIMVKVTNNDEYDYIKKIFAEKSIRSVGEVEGEAMTSFIS